MALQRRRCGRCGYDHYQDDELWLSVDELIDIVRMTVQEMLALPDQRLPAAERDRIRARQAAGRGPGPAAEVNASQRQGPAGNLQRPGEGRPR